jgi:hypothetical protein
MSPAMTATRLITVELAWLVLKDNLSVPQLTFRVPRQADLGTGRKLGL